MSKCLSVKTAASSVQFSYVQLADLRGDAEPVRAGTQLAIFAANARAEVDVAETLYVTSLDDVVIRSQQRSCLELAAERPSQLSSVRRSAAVFATIFVVHADAFPSAAGFFSFSCALVY